MDAVGKISPPCLYTFAAIVESMEESTVVAVLLLHVHWEVYFQWSRSSELQYEAEHSVKR